MPRRPRYKAHPGHAVYRLKTLGSFLLDFGKYKGLTLSELPGDYLRWLSQEFHGDPTIKWAAKQYLLAKRKVNGAATTAAHKQIRRGRGDLTSARV